MFKVFPIRMLILCSPSPLSCKSDGVEAIIILITRESTSSHDNLAHHHPNELINHLEAIRGLISNHKTSELNICRITCQLMIKSSISLHPDQLVRKKAALEDSRPHALQLTCLRWIEKILCRWQKLPTDSFALQHQSRRIGGEVLCNTFVC